MHSQVVRPTLITASPLATQKCMATSGVRLAMSESTGVFLCSTLLIKRHMESSPSLALALTTEPCSAPSPPTMGFVTVSETNLTAGLSVLMLFWLCVFILRQYPKWNTEVLIREEQSFSGFHCSGKKPKRRGKKWEHSWLMAREMKYLISKMLYVQGGLP